MQLADIQLLLKSEIELIEQVDLLECIQQHLIEPRCEKREWDYGEQGQAYPCWICLEDQDSNSAVAYCAEGFGPADPWGLLFLNGKHTSMGMDSGWFISLEQAVRGSVFWDGENPDDYKVE